LPEGNKKGGKKLPLRRTLLNMLTVLVPASFSGGEHFCFGGTVIHCASVAIHAASWPTQHRTAVSSLDGELIILPSDGE
jgi:hypothetical protein